MAKPDIRYLARSFTAGSSFVIPSEVEESILLAPHEIGSYRRVPPQVANLRNLVRGNLVRGHCERGAAERGNLNFIIRYSLFDTCLERSRMGRSSRRIRYSYPLSAARNMNISPYPNVGPNPYAPPQTKKGCKPMPTALLWSFYSIPTAFLSLTISPLSV